MPTSNTEELGRFLKCTVIGRGVFGPCASWKHKDIREANKFGQRKSSKKVATFLRNFKLPLTKPSVFCERNF